MKLGEEEITEANYKKTLAEIDRIFDAEANTAEDDRLDLLTTLVESYEERHYPIPSSE